MRGLVGGGRPRRLVCEKAIDNKGFTTFKEVSEACEAYARKHGEDVTFNERAIQSYVAVNTNLSMKRLRILAAVLGVRDLLDLDEIYDPPVPRGVGKNWVGRNTGTVVKDYDASAIKII